MPTSNNPPSWSKDRTLHADNPVFHFHSLLAFVARPFSFSFPTTRASCSTSDIYFLSLFLQSSLYLYIFTLSLSLSLRVISQSGVHVL